MRSSFKPSPPAQDPAAAQAFAAARNICRRHAKNIFYPSAFLPVAKRNAIYAIYAFHRLMREAIVPPKPSEIDVPAPSTVGVACCSTNSLDQMLALFRDRLDDIYAHRLELPLAEFRDESQHALHAFALTVHRYQIPKQYFLDLADGCRADLVTLRYATWRAVEKHCQQVAGALGLIASCVLGLTHSDGGKWAAQIGVAIRLTYILRDLKPDLARGRLYLPLEDLARFKITQAHLAAGVPDAKFQELMKFEIARARQLFQEGAQVLPWLEGDGSRWVASMFTVLQSGLLGAIERQNFDVFTRRAQLSTAEQFRRVAPAWQLARRRSDDPAPHVFR